MNRHERRAADAQHRRFVSSLKSDRDPREEIGKVVKQQFLADLKHYGSRETAYGVFGEVEGCDGYVEQVLTPDTGGTFMKIYGCSYLFKGHCPTATVNALQFPKSLFSDVSRGVARMPFVSLGIGLTWLFQRRAFLHFAAEAIEGINHRIIRHYDIPDKEGNVFPNELYRALSVAAEGEGLWTEIITKGARFLRLFLETDNSYRFRVQDALPLTKNVFEFLSILQSRETQFGIGGKWRFIRFVLRVALWTSPALRRIEARFFSTVDSQKVKMDEADWYFALNFKSYNFGGLDYKTRLSLRRRADKQHGHVFLI